MTRRHRMEVLHAIAVPPETAEALRALAKEWNRSLSEVVRAALVQFIAAEQAASNTPSKKQPAARILPARTSKQAYARYQDRWTQEDSHGSEKEGAEEGTEEGTSKEARGAREEGRSG